MQRKVWWAHLEDVCTTLEVRGAKLDLAVETTWSEQSRIKCVGPIRRHQHLDVPTSVESIELVDGVWWVPPWVSEWVD